MKPSGTETVEKKRKKRRKGKTLAHVFYARPEPFLFVLQDKKGNEKNAVLFALSALQKKNRKTRRKNGQSRTALLSTLSSGEAGEDFDETSLWR